MRKIFVVATMLLLCISLTACSLGGESQKENDAPLSSKFNGSKTILILGNSFVSTSQIGAILNDMLRESDSEYSVNAISRGFATVETYVSDNALMSEIENGNYCCVFQCGFYTDAEIQNYGIMKKACEKSDTVIMAFPAHNELSSAITKLKETEDCLDWKGEIESIMNADISHNASLTDFCIMDEFKHSTPLAGYVGAHMIYREVFGEIPPPLSDNAPITMEYVKEQLTHYPETGIVGRIE